MKKRFLTVFLSLILCLTSMSSLIGCGKSTFTVTFDPDGGELVSGELVQVVESAEDIVEPELKKEGYTLKGWDTVLSEITSDTTVKALWDKDKFTVKFIVDESTYYKSGELEQTVSSGEELVTPIYDRPGYDLVWDTDLKTITSSCVVKGTWVAKKYTLSFADSTGNKITSIADMEIAYESAITGLPTYSEEGKIFLAWKIGDYTINNGTAWAWTADKTAKPQWQLKQYTISYNLDTSADPNYGVDNKNNPAEYNIEDRISIVAPTRFGYTFNGWIQCDEDWTETSHNKITDLKWSANETTGNKYFKASWTPNSYTITLKVGDEHKSFANGVNTISVTFGQPVDIEEIEGDNPVSWVYKYEGTEYRICDGFIWRWTFSNDLTFEAEYYITAYKIVLDLTCVVRGRTVTSTVPAGTTMEYVLTEGSSIPDFPDATPEDNYEYSFTGWKYRAGNPTTGALTLIEGKSVSELNLDGYTKDNNGVVTITVYACCRSNWTPAY